MKNVCLSLAGCQSCETKTFNVGHFMQTVQPNVFIPAMLLGTIDFYHCIPLSLTLTLAEHHKVSAKQNLLTSFSR